MALPVSCGGCQRLVVRFLTSSYMQDVGTKMPTQEAMNHCQSVRYCRRMRSILCGELCHVAVGCKAVHLLLPQLTTEIPLPLLSYCLRARAYLLFCVSKLVEVVYAVQHRPLVGDRGVLYGSTGSEVAK